MARCVTARFGKSPQDKRLSTSLPSVAPETPKARGWVDPPRGALVDDEALIAELNSGHIRAARLDVYDGEPKVNPGYLTLENLTLLPHLGSVTIETRDAMGHQRNS
jgi:hypothetical protein